MLNVSSNDDRSTPARIRDAAIRHVGEHGWERTTSREIAAEAGVPVGLVNYHFGSKDGLRQACDDWVVDVILANKSILLSASSPLGRIDGYLDEHPELRPLNNYIGRSMRSGGPLAEHLFESMVATTQEMFAAAADAGTFRRFDDPYAAAVILVAYGIGASIYAPTIARLLGGKDVLDGETYAKYGRTTMDIFSQPLIIDEQLRQTFAEMTAPETPVPGEFRKENE